MEGGGGKILLCSGSSLFFAAALFSRTFFSFFRPLSGHASLFSFSLFLFIFSRPLSANLYSPALEDGSRAPQVVGQVEVLGGARVAKRAARQRTLASFGLGLGSGLGAGGVAAVAAVAAAASGGERGRTHALSLNLFEVPERGRGSSLTAQRGGGEIWNRRG